MIKLIKENEEILFLDTPTEYLCGPWYSMTHGDGFHLFKNCDQDNPYKLLNVKVGPSVNRITAEFGKDQDGNEKPGVPQTRFYADVYFTKGSQFTVFFYSIRNINPYPIDNVSLFNLYDFDLHGLEAYDTDFATYDETNWVIMQYEQDGLHAGISSIVHRPAHFQAGHPYELSIDATNRHLDDTILEGPDDLFVGLEWDLGTIQPGEVKTVPTLLAVGETREEFLENMQAAKEKARNLLSAVTRAIEQPERQVQAHDGMTKSMSRVLKKSPDSRC